MQVDALVFQGSPQPLDEDIIETASLAIHRDADASPAQSIRPSERCEQRSLISIYDLRRAKLVDGRVQGLNAEVCLQSIRDAPGQNLSRAPIHDGDKIQEPSAHGQIGNIRAPNLVRTFHPQTCQQTNLLRRCFKYNGE